MYQKKSTPVPIFNHRKRPRQAVIAGPDETCVGRPPTQSEFPDSNSFYSDLMPVTGFTEQNRYQNLSNYGKQKQGYYQNKTTHQSRIGNPVICQSKQVPKGNQKQLSSHPIARETTYLQTSAKNSWGTHKADDAFTTHTNNYNMDSSSKSSTNRFNRSMPPQHVPPQQVPAQVKQCNNWSLQQQKYGIPREPSPACAVAADISTHQFTPRSNFQGNSTATRVKQTVQTNSKFTGKNLDAKVNPSVKKVKVSTTPKPEIDKTLHVVTAALSEVKCWNKFKDYFGVLYVVFGVVDSAVLRSPSGLSKEFTLKDDSGCINCIFYEIDRPLPKLTRGHLYRVVGSFDQTKDIFKCVSIRSSTFQERAQSTDDIVTSESHMKQLHQMLREM